MKDSQNITQVSIGANPIHRFPKKYPHITTAGFMQFNVATAMEMPKSSIKVSHKTFVRSMPLKRPLMGSAQIKKQAYFVPYRTIWPAWTDFRVDTPHNMDSGTSILTNTPLISFEELVKTFLKGEYSQVVSNPSGTSVYDFVIPQSNSSLVYYKFKAFGRWAYKLLCSLGLRVPFMLAGSKDTISCLPILAVAKVYLDYFFPNQYAHYGVYATLDGYFNRNYIYSLTNNELDTIFKAIYLVTYDSDYFVSAFDSPVVGAQGVQSNDFAINDVSLRDSDFNSAIQSRVVQASNGTPIVTRGDSSSQSPKAFSQYIDSHLKALTNYITRHSLSGSRALERYLADWGVALDVDKLRRCYKLAETSFPLQVGDVTSQADTYNSDTDTGASLGDFAGRSVAYDGEFSFDCDTPEDGMCIVIYSIVPDTAICQGIQRYWWHKTKLDFLTGDFDGLSIREIKKLELFSGLKRDTDNINEVFGFVPSYAEYKTSYSIVSGDFLCDTVNGGLQGFELARLFSDEVGDGLFSVTHGLDFVIANDCDQFNRIFFDPDDDSDKFIVVHRAEMEHLIPAVPLYDTFDFEDSKKQIKLQVNGSKDN